jgi:16S rRNA (guanine(966)-N(2))-methyltransferase RsmD
MSQPRIISGKARGIRLNEVPGDITRPITDRVKEALYNIISTDIIGASMLDLFGGTGSVGIEALSRGASFVRLIDINRPAVETIKQNLARTRLENQAEVLRTDAFSYLRNSPDRRFDYIYVAPPQYKDLWLQAINGLDANPGWLADDGWVIIQIDPVEYQAVTLTHFEEFDRRRYGSTLLIFLKIFDEQTE